MDILNFGYYTCQVQRNENGIIVILSHPDTIDKIKIGLTPQGDIYLLEEFRWNNVNGSQEDKKYQGPSGLCDYIFDYYLGDIKLDSVSKQKLINIVTNLCNKENYTNMDNNVKPCMDCPRRRTRTTRKRSDTCFKLPEDPSDDIFMSKKQGSKPYTNTILN